MSPLARSALATMQGGWLAGVGASCSCGPPSFTSLPYWPTCWGKPLLRFDWGGPQLQELQARGRACQAPRSGAGQASQRSAQHGACKNTICTCNSLKWLSFAAIFDGALSAGKHCAASWSAGRAKRSKMN